MFVGRGFSRDIQHPIFKGFSPWPHVELGTGQA